MPKLVIALAVVFLGFLVSTSMAYIVDEREYAIVFALGEIKEVKTEPGLYFKAPSPFQNMIKYDNRIQTIDDPEPERFITSEKKNLLIDSYVKWRIADPETYHISMQGNIEAANSRISQIVKAALNEELTKRTVLEAVSGERALLMQAIVDKVKKGANEIGVDVVDVRLKRIDLPSLVSESVFGRMEAERKEEANNIRALGAAESEQIRADADRQREVILANAYRDAQRTKGEGDGQSAAIYNTAFGDDPEFFSFYRSLEAYRQSFSSKSDMLVLDPEADFFKFLRGNSGK